MCMCLCGVGGGVLLLERVYIVVLGGLGVLVVHSVSEIVRRHWLGHLPCFVYHCSLLFIYFYYKHLYASIC